MEFIIILVLIYWLGLALFLQQNKWTTYASIPVIFIVLWSIRWYIAPWLIFVLVTYLFWFLVDSVSKLMFNESNVVLPKGNHTQCETTQCETVQSVHISTEEEKLEERIISLEKDINMTTTRHQNQVGDLKRQLDIARAQIRKLDKETEEAFENHAQTVLEMLEAKDITRDKEEEILELENEIKHLKEMHVKVRASENEEQACIQASAAKAVESEKQAWSQVYAAKANTMQREIEIYELKKEIKSMSARNEKLLEQNGCLVEMSNNAITQVAITTIDQLPDTVKKQFEAVLQDKLDQQARRMKADKKKAIDKAKIRDINDLPNELKTELDKIHHEVVSKREAQIKEQFEKSYNSAANARVIELEKKLSSKTDELEAAKKASTAGEDQRVTELEKVVISKNAELDEEKKKKEDLQRQVNDMAKKAKFAEEQLKIRDELISTTAESTNSQQADIAGKSARILELENQLEQERKAQESQREQALVKDTQLNELNQLFSGATTKIQELEEHLKSAQEASTNLQVQLDISNNDVGYLVEQLDKTGKSLSETGEQAMRQTQILNAIECCMTGNEEPTGSIDHLKMVMEKIDELKKVSEVRDEYLEICLNRQKMYDDAIIQAGWDKEDLEETLQDLEKRYEGYGELQKSHDQLEVQFKELDVKYTMLLKQHRPIAGAKSVASKFNQSNIGGNGNDWDGSDAQSGSKKRPSNSMDPEDDGDDSNAQSSSGGGHQ